MVTERGEVIHPSKTGLRVRGSCARARGASYRISGFRRTFDSVFTGNAEFPAKFSNSSDEQNSPQDSFEWANLSTESAKLSLAVLSVIAARRFV